MKLQLAYPNVRQFDTDNFSSCPILLIEQALKLAEERNQEIASLHAVPVGLVGQAVCFINGVSQAETAWFNPAEAERLSEQAKRIFPSRAAQTLLELAKDTKLPSWVLDYLDLDVVKRAAS